MDELTPEQLDDWMAYCKCEPFGSQALATWLAHLWRSQLAKPDEVSIEQLLQVMGFDIETNQHFDTPEEKTQFALEATFGKPI